MGKTEVRLEYQRETGDALTTINDFAGVADNIEYVEWLEERVATLSKQAIRMTSTIKRLRKDR